MEGLIITALMIGVGYWLYRSGKRVGSIKGFNVGRWQRRRRR